MFNLSIEDKHGGIADEYTFEEGEFLIGRSHSADIILPSDNVSRRHARLYTVDGGCFIEDLGSANGVFVNGRRIHEVVEIEGSAQVRVGDYHLHLKSDTTAEKKDDVFCRLRGKNLSVADQVFPITRTVNLLGRGKDCTITVIDPSVSRIHAKLTVERAGTLALEDLKSSNGTFVNGVSVEGVIALSSGDEVRLGNVEFDVEGVAGASGEDASSRPRRGADASDSWSPPPTSSVSWMMVAFAGGLVLVLVVLWLAFSGDDGDTASGDEVASEVTKGSSGGEEAPKSEKKVSGIDEISTLVKQGNRHIQERQWDLALEAWKKVMDLNPLHPQARKAVNQISIWKEHKEVLREAQQASDEEHYGEAAKLLRQIDDSSEYYREAKGELKNLDTMKDSLVNMANSKLKAKDCSGALKLFEQAQTIDPRDGGVAESILSTKKKQGRKCP